MATRISSYDTSVFVDWYHVKVSKDILEKRINWSMRWFFGKPGFDVRDPIAEWIEQNCEGKYVFKINTYWFENKLDAIKFKIGMNHIL